MTEDFLHYLWRYKLFYNSILQTTNKQTIFVKKAGLHNKNEGPDFSNAHLEIDNQLWVGNIEIHIKSSDWYLHKHEEDVNYDAVILHVVWEHDVDIYMKNSKPLPTLELKKFVNESLLKNYNSLIYQKQNWIPCENQITSIDDFLLNNWLERLYFDRLERKSQIIKEFLQHTRYDFEATAFLLLAKNFGLKINGDAFLQMAKSIDFTVVRKVRSNEQELMALFFGQAGFLEEDIQDPYYKTLKDDYAYLKHKYRLKPISRNLFQFFRMRPNNFPTIRLAQLVALYFKHQNLFSKLMITDHKEQFYQLFSITIHDFWKSHYTFEKSSKKAQKKLTKSFIDLILINTIIPLKFVYQKNKGDLKDEIFLNLIRQVTSEKNSVISKFSKMKVLSKNALESQSLLELKNNYCTKQRCLDCAIGNHLLKA
ncbi:MAG: DUF2851 family protein [Polaribacter sp.]|nr:DUF2851 family protein [Polaribacter sp.]